MNALKSKMMGLIALSFLVLLELFYVQNVTPMSAVYEAAALSAFVLSWAGAAWVLVRRESAMHFALYTVVFVLLSLSMFPMRV